jgi:hypothetical protein
MKRARPNSLCNTLQRQVETLTAERDRLAQQLKFLQFSHRVATTNRNAIQKECNALQKEHIAFRSQHQAAMRLRDTTNAALHDAIKNLRDERATLKAKRKRNRNKLRERTALYETAMEMLSDEAARVLTYLVDLSSLSQPQATPGIVHSVLPSPVLPGSRTVILIRASSPRAGVAVAIEHSLNTKRRTVSLTITFGNTIVRLSGRLLNVVSVSKKNARAAQAAQIYFPLIKAFIDSHQFREFIGYVQDIADQKPL